MSDLPEILNGALSQTDLDLVDVIQIPGGRSTDPMVRLRTLEEALEEFDLGENTDVISYLVRLKPRRDGAVPHATPHFFDDAAAVAAAPRQPAAPELMYLPTGKLNVAFLFRNAELLQGTGDYALARNIYQAILKSGERTAQALFGTARCFDAEGKLDEARIKYEESITYQASLEAYQQLASVLIRQKKDGPAAEVFERALSLKDLHSRTRYELHKAAGNCWMRAEKADAAEKHYRKAIGIDPTADEMPANIGALHLQAGKTAEAKRHFQDAIAANPRNAKALAGLGSCYLSEGDRRAAHDHFARSLESDINNPSAIFYLVKCAYEIRSYATAARIVEEYCDTAPLNAHLLYSLAGLQFHLGRMNDVKGTIDRILMIAPEHAGARELLGRVH